MRKLFMCKIIHYIYNHIQLLKFDFQSYLYDYYKLDCCPIEIQDPFVRNHLQMSLISELKRGNKEVKLYIL